MKLRLFLAWSLLACVLISPVYASPAQFTGLTITRIDITDDQGLPWPMPEQVLPLVGMKPGDLFSRAAVRDGISLIYLKGLFKDVRVDAFPDAKGVRLVYVLVPAAIVEDIEVHGNHALSTDTITDALRSIEGKELRDKKLAALKDDVLALYQAAGYYGAEVNFRVQPLAAPHRVRLTASIHEAKPTRIADIMFSGVSVFQNGELLSAMKNRPGSVLRRDVLLDEDTEAILKKYTKAGYPSAKIGPVSMSFRDAKAYLNIMVTEGPKVTATFTGNEKFSASALSKSLLIWSEHDISDAIIDSSADKIKSLYRQEGYLEATVEVRQTKKPCCLDLMFVITEGPRVVVKEIAVRGNTVFPTKTIKKQMTLQERTWYFAHSPYREDLLNNDIDYLRDRYADAGYLSAVVKKKVTLINNNTQALVTIEITEGAQTRTGAISFEGNKVLTSTELLDKIQLKSGAPYNDRTADEDRYRVLTAYSNKGYLYARVDLEKKLHDNTMVLVYRITEDKPVTIGKVILRGNLRTKDEVIMRELLVKPGDTYDYAAILESQQRIYRLGYFRVARFEPVRPGEKEYVKDMLFTVEERPAGAMEIGFGYGDLDRLRGFVELSYRNLWGTARYTSIRFEDSEILKRAIFNYKEPWFLNRDLVGTFSLVWSDSERLNSDTREVYYKTRKTSASFGTEKAYGNLKPSLTYQFENVVNYDVQPAAVLAPDDIGRVLVSSLSPALLWDLRDDPFNPRRGALYGITAKEALLELGSQADFSKITIQGSWFLPVENNVLALSARAGMAWPFRDTPVVPLHERFYVGGSTTVRGYTQDSIGPSALNTDGSVIPTGGSSMSIFNLEFRINPGEGLGFVLFTDAGNVWQGQDIRVGDLRSSYGAGIRYGTPIGPLRIDYGQKIHRLPGESPGELHFNIGHTF
jgi:outer membrane protein insertion porin family